MIKELKYLFFLIIIFFFIFFTARYYFSDENIKKSYRSLSSIDEKINNKYEIQRNLVSLNTLARAFSKTNNKDLSKKYRELFENNYSRNAVN